jgi:hypothetical protein
MLQGSVVPVEKSSPDLFQPRPHFVRRSSEAALFHTRFVQRQTEYPTDDSSPEIFHRFQNEQSRINQSIATIQSFSSNTDEKGRQADYLGSFRRK